MNGETSNNITQPISPQEILKKYWGYNHFRPLQEDIIQAVLNDEDCLALLPTGGGKSICYQVPALCRSGLCLVISPLIALMRDQVAQLRKRGITAFALSSGMTRKELLQVFTLASSSNCKFLYVSPERLESDLFKEYLPGLQISMVAVDEAHCISQWGHDFRPSYRRIAALREELPNTPILALTASATPKVQEDILQQLLMRQPKIYRQSFERPQLSYSISRPDVKAHRIIQVLQKMEGSALVYCKSRKRTKEFSDLLKLQGISSDYYHAGLQTAEREQKQDAWIRGETRVICCTNAFGMGIDKPDVRVVIHADLPDCLENYYQEAGRAGRDGLRAYAVLLVKEEDIDALKKLPEIRFPLLDDIRIIYQSLMNYLQLPIHSGEHQFFDFDFADFVQKFKHPSILVMSVLKTLEQEGWISFNVQVFIPAKVQFICGKETLYNFEQDHPELEELIKTLLRTYEGIFDQYSSIQEGYLAGLLRMDRTNIEKMLDTLHNYRIINYQPIKNTPQLYFHSNRIDSAELWIDPVKFNQRKQHFIDNLDAFISFIEDAKQCRAQMIGQYFGDPTVKACGICDNCIQSKKNTDPPKSFEKISELILQKLSEEKTISMASIFNLLPSYPQEKIWKVVAFLEAEGIVKSNHKGWLEKL